MFCVVRVSIVALMLLSPSVSLAHQPNPHCAAAENMLDGDHFVIRFGFNAGSTNGTTWRNKFVVGEDYEVWLESDQSPNNPGKFVYTWNCRGANPAGGQHTMSGPSFVISPGSFDESGLSNPRSMRISCGGLPWLSYDGKGYLWHNVDGLVGSIVSYP